MKVLITGSNGFIGKNLQVRLSELTDVQVQTFSKNDSVGDLQSKLEDVDTVIHLAGVNRPETANEFTDINVDLTKTLCESLERTGRKISVIFASSIQAELDNPYGASKKQAEKILHEYSNCSGSSVHIYRLPNVFGKWCRPDYNSVVATFCHHIANDIPIDIHDSSVELKLVYIDDVIDTFISDLHDMHNGCSQKLINKQYSISVGGLAKKVQSFKDSRINLTMNETGNGLDRALHATFLSYLSPDQFSYSLVKHGDDRGDFVEILKTPNNGQFSYFTAKPGITRGGHYHHSKTEKFFVVKGSARFRFKNILTKEIYEMTVSDKQTEIVETIPGWAHDITNTGNDELIVFLWANEIFDKNNPDTIGTSLDD